MAEDRLRVSSTGTDRKISLTTERGAAEYFACAALASDNHDRPDVKSGPVVLSFDGKGLLELNYELEEFSDSVWGLGKCDWENEIACWSDITPLDATLIDIEPVADPRYQDFLKRRRGKFVRSARTGRAKADFVRLLQLRRAHDRERAHLRSPLLRSSISMRHWNL